MEEELSQRRKGQPVKQVSFNLGTNSVHILYCSKYSADAISRIEESSEAEMEARKRYAI